ncbi:hypothetical protein CC80DRAFT_471573 [Byssothecium circinans]|uniref:Transmembrane protein n=1 Tax=Byssothecium circinans TaxID=147558 RepID=A0A6A5TWU5_9PLEO|nr:hypothetical protein CC80DRAFT_471573 [Byssothecium circinans]
MSCDSCTYNCSTVASQVCPNPDVSGIGVVVGYTVNAGIVVMIIVVNYLLAFQPEMDPFRLDQPGALPRADFKPNPIDKLVIKSIRGKFRIRPKLSKRVEEALMKCVLHMSDLQILTGLSILISGFFQMPCGISRYHWKILVYLAWFSSLTHFGCLSFLRSYLFNHPAERTWRLFFMIIIAVMLAFALVPTGLANEAYGPSYHDIDYYGDPIICAFQQATSTYPNSMPFNNMVLSITFLAVGLFVRLCKLSQRLSVFTTARIRKPCSERAVRLLARVRAWSKIHESPTGMKRLLVYRPLLACFLLVRVAADLYSSMLGEVLWIMFNFVWGLIQLIQTRRSAHGGENDWSFGQVVPVVLIGAPLLMFYEFFYPGERKSSLQSTPSWATFGLVPAPVQIGATPALPGTPFNPVGEIHDEPEHDFYQASAWFQLFIILPIVVITELSGYTFFAAVGGRSIFESVLEWGMLLIWVIVYCLCSGVSYILLTLLLEHHKGNAPASPFSPFFASCMRTVLILFFVLLITIAWSLLFVTTELYLLLFWVFSAWIPVLCYPMVYIFMVVGLMVRDKSS